MTCVTCASEAYEWTCLSARRKWRSSPEFASQKAREGAWVLAGLRRLTWRTRALSWVRKWVSLTARLAGVSSGLYRVLARNLGIMR